MASSPPRERRIPVVEDEYLIAMSLQDALESVGSIIVGPVRPSEPGSESLRMARTQRERRDVACEQPR